jgi:predicted nucleic acid-binding protein
MSEICVDANLVIKIALSEKFSTETEQLFDECSQKNITIIAPPLIENETDSVIRRYVYIKTITEQEGNLAYTTIESLPVEIVIEPRIRRSVRLRARELAKLFNQVRVYDSTYAALAELRGCDFWTGDEKFFNSLQGKLPFVHFIRDYKGLP